MPDPAPMTVYRCKCGSCSSLTARYDLECEDCETSLTRERDYVPLADARSAVLAELKDEATVQVVAREMCECENAQDKSNAEPERPHVRLEYEEWKDEFDGKARAALSALAAHLAGEDK